MGKDKFAPRESGDVLQGGEAGADANVEVFEIAGAIKWFDVSKGYGFIVPDNGSRWIGLTAKVWAASYAPQAEPAQSIPVNSNWAVASKVMSLKSAVCPKPAALVRLAMKMMGATPTGTTV